MNLPKNQILCGDAVSILKQFKNQSVNLVITSPPYFKQREYAGGEIGDEHTVDKYIDAIMEVFHECVRVLKDDGNIVFNMGDKYHNRSLLLVPFRFALKATEQENVRLVNNITWMKSNPTPRQFNRRLVSSTEPFFHFAKSDYYYYDVDAFQKEPKKEKNLSEYKQNGKKSRIGQSYKDNIEKSDLSLEEKNAAYEDLKNVIDEVKHGKIFDFRMKIRGIHSPAFGGQSGGRATQMEKKGYTIIRMRGKKLKKDVIVSSVKTSKGYWHPAVYPQSIIEEFIKLLSRVNDIVLDPFMGSGTTAVAAKKLDRDFIGIDISPEYVSMAQKRLKEV